MVSGLVLLGFVLGLLGFVGRIGDLMGNLGLRVDLGLMLVGFYARFGVSCPVWDFVVVLGFPVGLV